MDDIFGRPDRASLLLPFAFCLLSFVFCLLSFVFYFCLLSFLLIFAGHRDVAQHGLEYSSGGRGVASSNLAIPTKAKSPDTKVSGFVFKERQKRVFVSDLKTKPGYERSE